MSPESIKDFATIASLVLATAGLAATAIQMQRNRNFQKENTAKAVYRDYLRMATDNPTLANGNYSKIPEEKREQYKWFVSYFLWACEEVINFAPRDPQWHEDIADQIKYHEEYLCSKEFRDQELPFYSSELQRLIADVCAVGQR
jgi:hypothetical protein